MLLSKLLPTLLYCAVHSSGRGVGGWVEVGGTNVFELI